MSESYPLITISGRPATGTTTLTEKLADDTGFEVLNGGDVFRAMADERGMSLAEFTELAGNDPSVDKELDDRLKAEMKAHADGSREPDGKGLIVESRLAGWHGDGLSDMSIWLSAPASVRLERLGGRDETPDELRERERSEADRYKENYGIDITDLSIYDVVLDTETLSAGGVAAMVNEAVTDACLK